MDTILRKFERRRKAHTIACFTFVAAIGVLYLTNILMRALVYHDSLWELLRDFAAPIVIVSVIYAVDWKYNFSTKLICDYLPSVSMTALCAPVIAFFLAVVSYDPNNDSIDINISFLAMLSMCTAPYALRNVQRACCAIVSEAILFVLLAVQLGNNVAAMVSIISVAATLLVCLPKLKWFNGDEEYVRIKTFVALLILFFGVMTILLIESTGVIDSIVICSFGRPGLGSSRTINAECFAMLKNARIMGSASCNYPMDNIFSNRVYTHILGLSGWLGVFPVIIATVLMITSGIYVSRRSIRVQHYVAVSSLTIIIVQSVAYVLMCCGWDELLFPELSPFLDGGIYTNTVFLLMAACILPPKQKRLLSEEEIEEIVNRMIRGEDEEGIADADCHSQLLNEEIADIEKESI